ncbi:serine hydrolase-domain-containing protein [Neohortaea acidophila]|uniref:Serine hydrolase-domain-containing protein n=1 Tax=Neohortaea acidophila TaxID=245834 RepID=A0A6A6Q2Z7_9PEZI|nr:serine hydrolase-domain-containing protein [Neohortaea acidophila]KAF2486033.1 serine hydrolase-domain-containing protein [Neohortaea acidophila]
MQCLNRLHNAVRTQSPRLQRILTHNRPIDTPSRRLTVMATSNGASQPSRTLKILMLHGFTQDGRLFEIKTKAVKKALEKAIPAAPKPGHLEQYPDGLEFHYPTAPIKLDPRDIPGFAGDENDQPEAYGWWRRKGDTEPFVYAGMEQGLARIAEVIKNEGPFDGVIGFSQGGAAAGMVAALLESGRREAFEAAQQNGGMRYPDSFVQDTGFIEETVQPPLKFAVSYSGFGASANALYQAFYEPKIHTPMMHFIGTVDTVVSEERSLRLVDACVNPRGAEGGVQRVVYHPGGHFLPSSQKQYVGALASFIRESVGDTGTGSTSGKTEERAEDMELPF